MTTHTFIHFCKSGNRLKTVYTHDGYLWARNQFWMQATGGINEEDEYEKEYFNGHILGWMHDIAVEVAYGNTAL